MEGASYKYLPPACFIELPSAPVDAITKVLERFEVPLSKGGDLVDRRFLPGDEGNGCLRRRAEGCVVVEMECATMAAIAQYRGKLFGQLLYSGDILVGNEVYDDRDWFNNFPPAKNCLIWRWRRCVCCRPHGFDGCRRFFRSYFYQYYIRKITGYCG